ncbi:hypothetical protein CICLE_v10003640mg, partial [Citrus x clementina]
IPIQKESTVTKQSIIQVTKFHDDLKRHCNCATRIYINNLSYVNPNILKKNRIHTYIYTCLYLETCSQGKLSCHDDDGGGGDEDEETTKKMK